MVFHVLIITCIKGLNETDFANMQIHFEFFRRPSGNPRKDLCDHVMQVKLAYKTQITSMLEKLEEENEKLTSDVLQKREKLVDTEKQLVENTEHLREVKHGLKVIK